MNQSKLKAVTTFIIPMVVGVIIFFVFGGLRIINPSDITWISSGDPAQHYIASVFYRKSEWLNPIGLNPGYGLTIGSSIVYSDSIPILAIVFKSIERYFNSEYQYFGIWYLICFIGQALFGWLIADIFSKKIYIKIISIIIFCFSPALLGLVGLTAALSAHFLLLWALYLILRKDGYGRTLNWSLLVLIALAVHFYLFLMVTLLWLASLIQNVTNDPKVNIKPSAYEFSLLTTMVILIAWQIGYFGTGYQSLVPTSQLSKEIGIIKGYGDITTAFNPYTLFVDPNWSYLQSFFPRLFFHIDNNNYLGLGLIVFLIFSILYVVIKERNLALNIINKNKYISLFLVLLIIFSISNNIHLGLRLLSIPLPEKLIQFASIARSSLRMIWPVYYLIFIFIIYVGSKLTGKKQFFYFVSLLFLQIIDTNYGWSEVRKKLYETKYISLDADLKNLFWRDYANKYSQILLIPEVPFRMKFEDLAFFSSKQNIGTNSVLLARVDLNKVQNANTMFDQNIKTGKYDSKTLYIFSDDLIIPIFRNLNHEKNGLIKVDGYNLIVSKELENKFKDVQIRPIKIPKVITINQKIYFGKNYDGFDYLLDVGRSQEVGYGWSYPEDWGVWSEGNIAKILVPVDRYQISKKVILGIKPFVAEGHSEVNVDFYLNNQFIKSSNFKGSVIREIELNIPNDLQADYLLVEFRIANSVSPKKLGLGSDIRNLGIGLESLVLIE